MVVSSNEMKYLVANTKKGNSYDPFAVNAAIVAERLQLAITSLTSLFALLITIHGTS